jgi:hypothetical protein
MSNEEVVVRTGPSLMTAAGGVILTLDASIMQTHTRTAAITEHPVEDGADITDHIRLEPIVVTINGVVTATLLGQQGDATREIDAWAVLEQVIEERQPVTLITTLRTYESMVVRSLSTERNVGLAHAIAPVLEFRQVRIVKALMTRLPPEIVKKPRQKATAPKQQDVGRQPTDVASDAQRTSALKSLLALLGGAPATP